MESNPIQSVHGKINVPRSSQWTYRLSQKMHLDDKGSPENTDIHVVPS
jgi:hypothetical protein